LKLKFYPVEPKPLLDLFVSFNLLTILKSTLFTLINTN